MRCSSFWQAAKQVKLSVINTTGTLYISPRCHIPWTHQELKYTIPTNFITYRFHVGVEPAHIIATCKNNLFIYCIRCLNTNTPIVMNHPICAPIRTIAPALYKLTI